MDPVTHSLTGAALSRTGLHRTTPLATATLVIAANAPDIDVVAMAAGTYGSLALRRGLTHGPIALVLLPFLVTGGMLLYDRLRRRKRQPGAAPLRPLPILGLATLGVLTHPALDWLNTYGIRLLMPFSERWFYGDSLFIIDPWIWLILAAPLVGLYARRRRGTFLWSVLGIGAAVLMLLAPGVPTAARVLWFAAALAVLVHAVRARRTGAAEERSTTPPPPRQTPPGDARSAGSVAEDVGGVMRGARVAVAAAAAYIVLMIASDVAGRSRVVTEAEAAGISVADAMLAPVPANPLAGEVVIVTEDVYHLGSFNWLDRPHVTWRDELPMGARNDIVEAAQQQQEVRDFLRWSRFPYVQVSETPTGHRVRFGDARYPGFDRGGLGGVTVDVDRPREP
jgi:inner membrane protein